MLAKVKFSTISCRRRKGVDGGDVCVGGEDDEEVIDVDDGV